MRPGRELARRLDAGALLAALVVESDDHTEVGDLPPGFTPAHLLLARLVAGAHLLDLVPAVGAAAGDDLAPEERLALSRWLRRVGEDVLAVGVAHLLPPVEPASNAGGGLTVCPALWARRLPLLPLAADAARDQPQGRLAVRAAALGGPAGLYRRGSEGGEVVLDLAVIGDDPHVLAEAWAHELSHALDPCLDPAASDRENFAHHLAPHLLSRRPRTAAEAAPLIAETEKAIGRTTATATATPDLGDYLRDLRAWQALDFASLQATLAEAELSARPRWSAPTPAAASSSAPANHFSPPMQERNDDDDE